MAVLPDRLADGQGQRALTTRAMDFDFKMNGLQVELNRSIAAITNEGLLEGRKSFALRSRLSRRYPAFPSFFRHGWSPLNRSSAEPPTSITTRGMTASGGLQFATALIPGNKAVLGFRIARPQALVVVARLLHGTLAIGCTAHSR